MKKIMFNDKYGLTKAVLEGRKTQTRRIVKHYVEMPIINSEDDLHKVASGDTVYMEMSCVFGHCAYAVGEEVAVAQSYKDCLNQSWIKYIHDIDPDVSYDRELSCSPAEKNKMFVRADLMPHRIKITNIRIERLQEISNEDCLKEGIICKNGRYRVETNKGVVFYTTDARQAFAYLIDKVSGKGTWDSNPYVFVYDFELVK